jgi:Ala-tRNA(Pro) deacylase
MDNYCGQAKVYDILNQLSIPFEYYAHDEAPTIEIAKQFYRGEGTTLCKNLFFRNHKGNRHYLVVLECDRILDIHDLEKRLNQGKLSFASQERMVKYLGLSPGSVSPFGLINDKEHHVHVFFDNKLQYTNKLSFHPNLNTASIVLATNDFIRYMNWVGNSYEFIRLYED